MKPSLAHSNGEALVPDEPVELPSGTKYRVTAEPLEEEGGGEARPLRELAAEFAGKLVGDYPPDLAKNHDHYLHGRPKRP
jgi:hypothetical protein